MVQGLQELLTLTFKPEPRPKPPPTRLFRVGWWKPTGVKGSYGKLRFRWDRFHSETEAVEFAARKDAPGHAVRAERWVEGGWRTIPTAKDLEQRERWLAEHAAQKRLKEGGRNG